MRPTAQITISAVIATLLGSQAVAQTRLSQDPANADPYALEESSMVAPALGLQLLLPKDAMVTSDQRPGMLSYLISDGVGEKPTWSMRIQPLNSRLQFPSAAGLIEQYLRAVADAKILINEPVNYANRNGHQLFVERPATTDRSATVQGWVILPTSPSTFIVFTVVTKPDRFSLLQGQLKASFSTIVLLDNDQKNAQRMAKLARGRAIINTFTPSKLKTLIGRESCYRIYTPSQTGKRLDDQEIGYMTIQCNQGMRGQLNPNKNTRKFTQMESEQGLMVTVKIRILGEKPNRYLDIQSYYWLAWDRSSESWSTLTTQRHGKKVLNSSSETGVRQLGRLTVITSDKSSKTREPKEWSLPDAAYLSQPEVFLLGALLPRDKPLTQGMSFYSYDAQKKSMPLRTNTWEPTNDGSGNWVLTTSPAKELTSVRQIIDPKGNLIRRISDSGIFFESIDQTELRKLWHSKGLSS
ncbi:MAG: hypothetical protein IH984_14650 [Planctomycetes bacterium]|nr:hypothetical protein [Planctomycetota bacterium]